MKNKKKIPEGLEFRILLSEPDEEGEPDEGEWRIEAWYDGQEVGHAKFDVWFGDDHVYTNLLILQISVDERFRRLGIATAILNELSSHYECPINVEDFTPDGRALFGGRYHW